MQVAGDAASTFTVPTTPSGPGAYTCGINPGQIISDVNWTITFTLRAIPDYDVTTASGVMTVTNNTNHADPLAVFEQAAGNIAFSAAGRTFSLNGGANNNAGALISLSSITSITINGGSGGETFNVGGFSGSSFPSLTIIGGVGNDTVNFTGSITFASGNSAGTATHRERHGHELFPSPACRALRLGAFARGGRSQPAQRQSVESPFTRPAPLSLAMMARSHSK